MTQSASTRPLSASKAGAISSARRISSVATSRPSARAAARTSANSSTAPGLPTWAMIANRRRSGTTSRNSSRRLPARSVDWSDRPVMLPPGRDRLATKPLPTGSFATANTIGMTDVACFTASSAVPDVTMTSTFSWTNSAAISTNRSSRPSPHRYSTAMVRPSIQPKSRNRCAKAATHWLQADGVVVPRNPIVGSFPACCARAATGHVAAAPPTRVMNSRRFTAQCLRASTERIAQPEGLLRCAISILPLSALGHQRPRRPKPYVEARPFRAESDLHTNQDGIHRFVPGADTSHLRRLVSPLPWPLQISDNSPLLWPLMTQEKLRAYLSTDHPSSYRACGRAARSGGRTGAGENPRRLGHHPSLAYSTLVSQARGHQAPRQVLH